jgi:two-component system, NarL family, invasion response regulator UvrY
MQTFFYQSMLPDVNVLIADDHPVYRRGLLETIRRYAFIKDIYEASTGFETMHILQHHTIHVVYLDCSMPGMDGMECLPLIREQFPATKVIVISLMHEVDTIMTMVNGGAHAYLLKDKSGTEIHDATKTVLKGLKYFDPAVMHIIEGQLTKPATAKTTTEKLSAREHEVLLYIALGYSAKEIVDRLGLSLPTLSQHRTSGMKKINALSNTDVTRYFLRNGYISIRRFMKGKDDDH